MIKWSTLDILYIKTQTRYYLLTKNFKTKSGNFSVFLLNGQLLRIAGRRVGLSETGVDGGGGEFSLFSSSTSRMGFSAEPRISKSSNAVEEKGVSMPHLKIASTSADHFHSRIQHRPDQQKPDTRLCPYHVQLLLKVLRPSVQVLLAG